MANLNRVQFRTRLAEIIMHQFFKENQFMSNKSEPIKGKAFVLGKNIDTDQIIPAAHLVYSLEDPEERKMYGKYALSGVPAAESGLPHGNIPLTSEDRTESEFSIIVASDNFGCGSSREHALASLEIAGIKAIVSPSYARINSRSEEHTSELQSRGHLVCRLLLEIKYNMFRYNLGFFYVFYCTV